MAIVFCQKTVFTKIPYECTFIVSYFIYYKESTFMSLACLDMIDL